MRDRPSMPGGGKAYFGGLSEADCSTFRKVLA